jgi:hypothetical protein
VRRSLGLYQAEFHWPVPPADFRHVLPACRVMSFFPQGITQVLQVADNYSGCCCLNPAQPSWHPKNVLHMHPGNFFFIFDAQPAQDCGSAKTATMIITNNDKNWPP